MPGRHGKDSPKLVWYACYGSNLSYQKRFVCYIAGGRPPGSQKTNQGCRDKTPPHESKPITLDFELYFASYSQSWGGAPAFLRRGPRWSHSFGRRYLITDEQFNDVVIQENDGVVDGTRFVPPYEQLTAIREFDLPGNRLYGHLLNLGKHDGYPVLTFTTVRTDLKVGAPSEAYVKIIVAGLKETYPRESDSSISRYLQKAEGIRDLIQPDVLARWVAEVR